MNKGKIVQIIGPVVDVEFAGAVPANYNALIIQFTPPGGAPTKLTLEVQQHLGEKWVRSIAMSATEGLKRGMKVNDTGGPISVPVGEGAKRVTTALDLPPEVEFSLSDIIWTCCALIVDGHCSGRL